MWHLVLVFRLKSPTKNYKIQYESFEIRTNIHSDKEISGNPDMTGLEIDAYSIVEGTWTSR